ncbi:flagellum-specific ATP synthase [compost metagenome]
MPELASEDQRSLAVSAVQQLAVLERNRQMVDIGAYEKGSNAELDRAIEIESGLQAWLRQSKGGVSRSESIQGLQKILTPTPSPGAQRQ